jgi:hypothetical protein
MIASRCFLQAAQEPLLRFLANLKNFAVTENPSTIQSGRQINGERRPDSLYVSTPMNDDL